MHFSPLKILPHNFRSKLILKVSSRTRIKGSFYLVLDDFKNEINQFVQNSQQLIDRKSNIVDVCALLDMKSSKCNQSSWTFFV